MTEVLLALLVFVCLTGASFASLFVYGRLPDRHRQDDTQNVVRLIANIFVVMTSLVLGLMINSAKGRFDGINRDMHSYATDLILLDRVLVLYGPDAKDTRQRLLAYTQRAASDGRWTSGDKVLVSDQTSEQLLNDVGSSLRALKPGGDPLLSIWNDAREQYKKLVELRWALLEQSEGSIPTPLLAMVVAWLMLIFASFGFRAPRNAIVVASFVLASGLITGALYLIVDMDSPFEGPIQISSAPLQRVIAEMQR
jgi:Protein of unknown function (DUF4239)